MKKYFAVALVFAGCASAPKVIDQPTRLHQAKGCVTVQDAAQKYAALPQEASRWRYTDQGGYDQYGSFHAGYDTVTSIAPDEWVVLHPKVYDEFGLRIAQAR